MTSGNLGTIVARITIPIEKKPIQFCLYGATTSSRSLSLEIDPSIAFFRVCVGELKGWLVNYSQQQHKL